MTKRSRLRRPAILVAAVLLDVVAGDPPNRAHPVAWFGRLAKRWEQHAPSRPFARFAYGALGAVLLPNLAAFGASLVVRRAAGAPAFLLETAVLKSTFALRGLLRAVDAVAVALDSGDADQARAALPSLVSRDVQSLDRNQIASAAIESAAENVTDAFLAPWLFYALGGLPAAAGYRAINTLDAMWGYRTPRYEHFGKAAARLDDAANYAPGTLAPRLMLLAGRLLGYDAREGRRILDRDGARTSSPNAGRAMSTMAGLLGVRLEKPNEYALGDARRSTVPFSHPSHTYSRFRSLMPKLRVSTRSGESDRHEVTRGGDVVREAERIVWATAGLGLLVALALAFLRGEGRR